MVIKENEPVNYFFQEVPIYGSIITRADQLAREKGMSRALEYAVNWLKWRALIRCPQESVSVLGADPCLIVVNHPAQIEPLLVAWAISRWRNQEDVFLIGDADLSKTGPDIGRLFLPIYGTSTRSTRRLTILRKKFQALWIGTGEENAFDRRNLASLTRAAEMIKQGGVVVITPLKDPKEEGWQWHPGIGWLAKQALNKGLAPYVILADVSGTSPLDFLRFLPGANTVLQNLRVEFSLPAPLAQLIQPENRLRNEGVTKGLQDHYEMWMSTRRSIA